MSDQVITKDQILELIKREGIKIDDLYAGTPELSEYRRRVEADLALEREKAAEEAKSKPEDKSKYVDPKRNPFIKP